MRTYGLTMILAVIISLPTFSQGFSGFIAYLNSLPLEDRPAAVDSFMIAVEPYGFPYITGDSANFIFRGEASSVKIAGDFNGWDPGFYFLAKVAGTDFYFRSKTFEMNARLDYKYVINDASWILDPLNPNTCAGGFGPNSELAMPGYIQPWEIGSFPGIPQGNVVTDQIASTNTNSTFQLKIYLPYGYNENLPGGYPVVYFQDGFEYISLGFADNVLNNLIDSNLCSPVIAVFVKPNNRNEEYAGSLREEYQLFFADELVPHIDQNYNTIENPWGRAVLGDSFGGNISALIAYHHAGLFGNCGLHSGAFWPNDFEAYHLITQGEVKPIRWVSIWGTYEGLWENMRDFRDFLIENNCDLHWQELPEGHSWGLWRATIDEMVPYFFPPDFMGTGAMPSEARKIIHIYPNPASDHITVESVTMIKKLQVIDLAGKIIEEKYPGSGAVDFQTAELKQGIYFMKIFSEEGIIIRKFLVGQDKR